MSSPSPASRRDLPPPPAWIFVGTVAVGDLNRLATAERNRPDIEAPRCATLICKLITLGRKYRRGVVVARECDPLGSAARHRHHVDLRIARAIRGEREHLAVG